MKIKLRGRKGEREVTLIGIVLGKCHITKIQKFPYKVILRAFIALGLAPKDNKVRPSLKAYLQ